MDQTRVDQLIQFALLEASRQDERNDRELGPIHLKRIRLPRRSGICRASRRHDIHRCNVDILPLRTLECGSPREYRASSTRNRCRQTYLPFNQLRLQHDLVVADRRHHPLSHRKRIFRFGDTWTRLVDSRPCFFGTDAFGWP